MRDSEILNLAEKSKSSFTITDDIIRKMKSPSGYIPTTEVGKMNRIDSRTRGKIRAYGHSLNGKFILGLKGTNQGYFLISIEDFRANPSAYVSFQNLFYSGLDKKNNGVAVVSEFLKSNPIKGDTLASAKGKTKVEKPVTKK